MPMSEEILQVKNILKRFGATLALNDVSMSIKKGTVHSLVGRNGAGKTTLVNIIAGIYRQDEGQVILEGKEVSGLTVFERQKEGIRIVTQHASIIPHMSVAENIFLGLWPKNSYGMVDWKALNKMAVSELEEYGLYVDPNQLVGKLSPVDQRKVNIIRALYGGGKLIILDEPTTSLTSEDRDSLFNFVKKLSDTGTSFILISHYLEEILRLSDEITVLRDGKAYSGYTRGHLNEEKLANMIAGEDVVLIQREKKVDLSNEDVVIECKNLCSDNLVNVSMELRRGEVIGVVGFPGSGARELCRTFYGLSRLVEGEIKVKGKSIRLNGPNSALDNGIVYIPNDRHTEGIVQLMPVRENISLPILKRKLKGRWGLINSLLERNIANEFSEKLRVKANSVEDPVSSLSGGNQQKVVVAKVLSCDPTVLILDEPTVGIDVKSREEILSIVNKMTEEGMSVIYLTNDFDELLRISDRLIFFNNGRTTAVRENIGLTAEDVIKIRDSAKDGAYEYKCS